MKLSQIAQIINYTNFGTVKLLKKLNIPIYIVKRHYHLNVNSNHPFALSIRQQHQQPHLQVFYSLKELSEKYHKDKRTIYHLLNNKNITIHNTGRKYIVFLWDLKQLEQQLRTPWLY